MLPFYDFYFLAVCRLEVIWITFKNARPTAHKMQRDSTRNIRKLILFIETNSSLSLLSHRACCYIYFIQNQLMHFF
jgi:hypothetical protein